MSQVESGGTIYFRRNGAQMDVEGNVKISYGGKTRVPKVGTDGRVVGWTTKYSAPSISVDVTDSKEVKLADLQSVEGETVTAELGNGKTYILESAFTVGKLELDTVEGRVPWELSGMSMIEQ